MRIALLASLVIFSPLLTKADDVIGYWALNNTLARTDGTSGNLSAYFVEVGLEGHMGYAPGTTVNSILDTPAGEALSFGSFATILSDGYIEITGLNFTGYRQITFSFAGEKSISAQLFSTFALEYRTNGGWQIATTLAELPTVWTEPIQYVFRNDELMNATNAGIRLHFRDMVDIASYAKFDNIQITANTIPEPHVYGLLAGAFALFLGRRFFRSRVSS